MIHVGGGLNVGTDLFLDGTQHVVSEGKNTGMIWIWRLRQMRRYFFSLVHQAFSIRSAYSYCSYIFACFCLFVWRSARGGQIHGLQNILVPHSAENATITRKLENKYDLSDIKTAKFYVLKWTPFSRNLTCVTVLLVQNQSTTYPRFIGEHVKNNSFGFPDSFTHI